MSMVKVMLTAVVVLAPLLFAPGKVEAKPVILFSDMTDGPTTGWESSATRGAAISIWGRNFGLSRGTSVLTVGGVTLSNAADFAEWGATTNPTTAMGLQRITFFLNSTMSTAGAAPNTSIKVKVGSEESNSVPFHCRAIGSSHIFFISPTGNDSASGLSTAAPWRTGAKIRKTVAAGDVVYFREGVYVSADMDNPARQTFIVFRNNHQNGTAWNTITLAAYPGEKAQIGDGEISASVMRGFLNIYPSGGVYDQVNYWNFSKFYGNLHSSMTSYYIVYGTSAYDNCRFVGCEVDTSYSTSGTGIGFTFGPANNTKLLGNYFHHCGMGNPPATPGVGIGSGTGLTGNYRAILTFASTTTAGSRANVYNETLPSPATPVQELSNASLRVSWSGFIPSSYNTVNLWRTKAGGTVYYLDKSVAAAEATGTLETSTTDAALTQELDFNGFNATTYYRAGMPWYFGGYGVVRDIEIAYNEASYNYSGAQFYGHTTNDKLINLSLHSNYFHHNDRRAITIGGGDGGAYTFVQDAYVFNNVFYRNESAIKLNGGTNGDGGNYFIFNNTFHQNQKGGGEPEMWLIGKPTGTMVLKNNIISTDPALSFGYVTYHQGDSTGISGTNNIWTGKGSGPSWDELRYDSVDPQFLSAQPVKPTDFQIQPGSAARDRGTDTSGVVASDFLKGFRPVQSVYDIGAFEYNPGTDTVPPAAPNLLP